MKSEVSGVHEEAQEVGRRSNECIVCLQDDIFEAFSEYGDIKNLFLARKKAFNSRS